MANDLNDDERLLSTEREVWDAKRRRVLDPNLDRDFDDGGRSLPGDGFFDPETGAQAPRRPPAAAGRPPVPGRPPTPRMPPTAAPGHAASPSPPAGGPGVRSEGGAPPLELDLDAVERTRRRPTTEAPPAGKPPSARSGAPSPRRPRAKAGAGGVVGVLVGSVIAMIVVGLAVLIAVVHVADLGGALQAGAAAGDEAELAAVEGDEPASEAVVDNAALRALDEPPAGARFTEEGIVLALQAGGWRMLDRTGPTALSSFHFHNYIFGDRDATLDVTIYTGRTTGAVDELGENRRDPSIDVLFDHRLVRITPRNNADRYHARRMRDLLERYHAMVTEQNP